GREELSQRSATIGPDAAYGCVNGGLVNVRPGSCALLSSALHELTETMPAVHCTVEREHAPGIGCHGTDAEPADARMGTGDPSYMLCAPDPDGDAPRYHGW